MHNFDRETQDQRTNSGMEDSNTMTIEFLRARLLSERAVSKSTRQRADELARRVAELEEQLEIVSLQRRKAEKATADVLAILESNGVSDISEDFGSSSDEKVDNSSAKEGESSVDSNLDSPVNGRSLSWKGRKSASKSPEKRYKDSLARRRSSFSSVNSSSPRHRQGKSCRRHRESRSFSEGPKTSDVKVDSRENGIVTLAKVNDNQSEGDITGAGSEIPEDTRKDYGNSGNRNLSLNGYEGEKDMEKALEHQARLIGRYEAMERAQREWEEKFRENNTGIQDSFDPGNHSDISEEITASQAREDRREHDPISKEQLKAQSRDFVQPSQEDSNPVHNQRHASSSTTSQGPDFRSQDFAFPVTNGNYNRDHQEAQFSSHSPPQFMEIQPQNQHSSGAGSSSGVLEASRRQHDQYAMVPHEPSSGFSGVLDALKQAKLSLQQKIEKSSLVDGNSIQLSIPATKAIERPDIPVGCAGLFRTPNDFLVDSSKDYNLFGSSCRLSLPSTIPNAGFPLTTSNQLFANSYMNTGVSSSHSPVAPGNQFLASPYMAAGSSTASPVHATPAYMNEEQFFSNRYPDAGSQISAQRPGFDPHMSAGLQNYPTFSTFPRSIPGTPGLDGFPALNSSRSIGSQDMFPFHNKHFRPDMYR